jgi:hypothetical protein
LYLSDWLFVYFGNSIKDDRVGFFGDPTAEPARLKSKKAKFLKNLFFGVHDRRATSHSCLLIALIVKFYSTNSIEE